LHGVRLDPFDQEKVYPSKMLAGMLVMIYGVPRNFMPGFLFSEQELGYVSWHIAVMINMDMPLLLCSTGM
jgi:hypothetical protein